MYFVDDKSIRVWEFGVPVQAKYIADPSMHAISAAALTPNGKWWLGQSADNHIVTYSANDKVRPNRKKTFSGHSSAGYACQVGASHDNQYIYSGDGEGRLFIWDWKTKKVSVFLSIVIHLHLIWSRFCHIVIETILLGFAGIENITSPRRSLYWLRVASSRYQQDSNLWLGRGNQVLGLTQ